MRLVLGHDAAVSQWVASRLPHSIAWGEHRAIGVARDNGALVFGVVYHHYEPAYGECEIGAAGERVMWTRRLLQALLAVPFVELGCRRVTAIIGHDNTAGNDLLRRLGFKREGCIRHRFAHKQHGAIYGLTRSEFDALCARLSRARETT